MAKKNKNTKAAPALGKDAAIPATDGGIGPAGSTGGQVSAPGSAAASAGDDSRPLWVWRDFARYGAAAMILFLGFSFLFETGSGCVREYREFRQWRKEYRQDGGGGETNPAPIGSLETWIRRNLPPEGAGEYADVADAFETVAEKLRSGALAGPRSACAETIAYLTPVAPRRVWGAFLRELYARAVKEAGSTNEELAGLWDRIAKAIRAGRAARPYDGLMRGALGLASPALSSPAAPDPEPGSAIIPDDVSAGPSGSLAADQAETAAEPGLGGEATAGDLLPAADAAVAEAVEEEAAPETVEETAPPAEEAEQAEEPAEKENASAGGCPTGNCPANSAGSGYGYGYGWNYGGGWYWPYYGGGVR